MKKKILMMLALLCAIVQGTRAQNFDVWDGHTTTRPSQTANGGYCINIVPVLNGEKGSYSVDANVEIKNEWVVAPSLNCEQLADNQIKLTWKAPGNIESYHITVLRGDNNSILRFVDLDFSKYTEFDVPAVQGDMEYIYTYDDPIDSVNGTKMKFEIYGIRRTTTGGEQRSATSSKTIILK